MKQESVLQLSTRIYSADLPSLLVDVYVIALATVTSTIGITAGYHSLMDRRKKLSKLTFPTFHKSDPYMIPMPNPKNSLSCVNRGILKINSDSQIYHYGYDYHNSSEICDEINTWIEYSGFTRKESFFVKVFVNSGNQLYKKQKFCVEGNGQIDLGASMNIRDFRSCIVVIKRGNKKSINSIQHFFIGTSTD